jgi:hypothetical protein
MDSSQSEPEVPYNANLDKLDTAFGFAGRVSFKEVGNSPAGDSGPVDTVYISGATVEPLSNGAALLTFTPGNPSDSSGGPGSPIDVMDGTTTVSAVTAIRFTSGAIVSASSGSVADVAIAGGGGSGGNSTSVSKLVARAYVAVTNPNIGPVSLTPSNTFNVASIAITALGRYRVTFTSSIPANCTLEGNATFDVSSSTAVALVGIDRHSGFGMGTATLDIAVAACGDTTGAINNGNFDPLWFYFEVRDPGQLVGSASVYGPSTVAALPASPDQGARAFVTDATATTFLSTVAGGGSDKVPVVYDGTDWVIG